MSAGLKSVPGMRPGNLHFRGVIALLRSRMKKGRDSAWPLQGHAVAIKSLAAWFWPLCEWRYCWLAMALPLNEQGPQRIFDNLHLENSLEDNAA